MYKFVSSLSENKAVGVLAGALYILAPYHLTDLYVRNAIAEYASFMFIPLVFWGLCNIFDPEDEGKNYKLTIGAVGLIYTHNLATLFTAMFALIYVIVNFKHLKEKKVIKALAINLIFILIISAAYLLPMLETKLSADYRVYEEDAMATEESVEEQRISIKRIFVTANGESFVFELGPYMIIMLGFSFMTIRIIKSEYKKDYIYFLVMGLITLIMTTKIFPWKILPDFFNLIQFPWRLLEYTSFFFSIVAAINMGAVIKKYSLRDAVIIIVISTVYIIALNGFVSYRDESVEDIESYSLGYISGMDNEYIAGMGYAEYLPKNAYENRFYIATREDKIYVLTGKAIVEDEEKSDNYYTASIETLDEDTTFELPYIYYPGYTITADGIELESFETENGLLGFKLDAKDDVTLEVTYTGTSIMKISAIVSSIGIIALAVLALKKHK